jgi:hypothetical protein
MQRPQAEDNTETVVTQSEPSPEALAAGAAFVTAYLELQHPRRPGMRKVPWPVRRLLPDPIRDWARMVHADIAEMTQDEMRRELFRLRVGLAQVDRLDAVCTWVFERLSRLECALKARVA